MLLLGLVVQLALPMVLHHYMQLLNLAMEVKQLGVHYQSIAATKRMS
jgi:hypothetical protein